MARLWIAKDARGGLAVCQRARAKRLSEKRKGELGLENNRRTLETFVRYMHEQELIPEPMPSRTLFPDNTQRTFRV
jgi:hypothetical protein